MEGRRKPKGDYRRSVQSRKPPRGSWQPTVPSWEKDFCKVVGSLDWENILQMKKFTHLYSNVLNWNDSAGEEAFLNAKKRYWAKINNYSCDIPLPDPNLYLDKINWDSETDLDFPADAESKLLIPNTEDVHDPVVIFGDSLLPNQVFLPAGWGDEEDKNIEVPFNHSSGNYGFGNSVMTNQPLQPTGWDDFDENWCNPVNNRAPAAWPGYSDSTWQLNGPAGYVTWGRNWSDDCGWGYPNNDYYYAKQVPDIEQGNKQGTTINASGNGSNHGTQRVQGKVRPRNHHSNRNEDRGQPKMTQSRWMPRKWNSVNSAIRVGQSWNP